VAPKKQATNKLSFFGHPVYRHIERLTSTLFSKLC